MTKLMQNVEIKMPNPLFLRANFCHSFVIPGWACLEKYSHFSGNDTSSGKGLAYAGKKVAKTGELC